MTETISLILGYLATLLLALSLLVNNDIRFRWLNSFGSASFILYGLALGAFPVMITNGLLLCINIYYLIKIYRTHEDFDLLEFRPDDKIVNKYLTFYKKDISTYFPGFILEDKESELRFVVLRDLAFANIFVAHITPEGIAYVKINYTVPKYRDLKVGRFIFDQEKKCLIGKGVKQIAYREVYNKDHERFLRVMEFKKEILDAGECYVKRIG